MYAYQLIWFHHLGFPCDLVRLILEIWRYYLSHLNFCYRLSAMNVFCSFLVFDIMDAGCKSDQIVVQKSSIYLTNSLPFHDVTNLKI